MTTTQILRLARVGEFTRDEVEAGRLLGKQMEDIEQTVMALHDAMLRTPSADTDTGSGKG